MIRKLRGVLALLLCLLLCGGALAEDTYFIEVDITNQIVTVYYDDLRHEGGIVRQMICSTGENDCTPTGHFELNQRNNAERTEWYAIPKYDCYVQYVTRIYDAYLFHSLPYHDNDYDTLDQEAAAQLGEAVSHGCIRLRPEDAKWIAKNCPNGTKVHIYHSYERDEFLRDRLLEETFSIDGEWFSYADYLGSAGGLTAAVEAMITRQKIEGVVVEVTPMPEAE